MGKLLRTLTILAIPIGGISCRPIPMGTEPLPSTLATEWMGRPLPDEAESSPRLPLRMRFLDLFESLDHPDLDYPVEIVGVDLGPLQFVQEGVFPPKEPDRGLYASPIK